ncbi:hypothetical protein [Micromonospora radicis]|uniref:LPXTG cell wall anchor domain-containing protein n=1 Tax=Micromonospora radicis TaxID=1894971 RepID=A0A418N191_9ACTN|nr:hypothetical protein [Micromonospora radicis]RIV41316.1 hypothetical protein D2L64_00985 [Micromonospora radicis]
MRLSRIIMALTVGLAVATVPAAAGAAQPQPAPSPSPTATDPPQPPPYTPELATLTANQPSIVVGETVVLTGRDFGPNETVDLSVTVQPLAAPAAGTARRGDGSTVAMVPVAFQAGAPLSFTARTNSNGVFTRRYTPSVTGLLTITAVGRESGRTASTELRVLHKRKPHLPVTGSSLDTPLKVGGGLVATGAVLLLGTMLWRRRSRFGTR